MNANAGRGPHLPKSANLLARSARPANVVGVLGYLVRILILFSALINTLAQDTTEYKQVAMDLTNKPEPIANSNEGVQTKEYQSWLQTKGLSDHYFNPKINSNACFIDSEQTTTNISTAITLFAKFSFLSVKPPKNMTLVIKNTCDDTNTLHFFSEEGFTITSPGNFTTKTILEKFPYLTELDLTELAIATYLNSAYISAKISHSMTKIDIHELDQDSLILHIMNKEMANLTNANTNTDAKPNMQDLLTKTFSNKGNTETLDLSANYITFRLHTKGLIVPTKEFYEKTNGLIAIYSTLNQIHLILDLDCYYAPGLGTNKPTQYYYMEPKYIDEVLTFQKTTMQLIQNQRNLPSTETHNIFKKNKQQEVQNHDKE